MATTTTNFGWDIPQSTDLVKDGATAIAALGQDIDTALVDLKGGTTGQVLAKASGTDLDFSWVAQDDSNAIQNAIVDAKGDLISATAADTPARLAVGTNGYVLTADSAEATGLKWAAAGGKVLQVVQGTTSTGTTISTSTFTDTGLTASITPTLNTSKILVMVVQMSYSNRAGTSIYSQGRIMRGATSVFENTYIHGFNVPNATGTIEFFATWAPVYLDSPATTSAITYKTQQATNGSGTIVTSFGSNPSAIILMEIGA